MAHTFTNLLIHIIFGTKDRHPSIDEELRGNLHGYLGGIAKGIEVAPITIGGTEDHVHLLVDIKARHSVADVVNKLKSNSSSWVHEAARTGFAWQSGYCALSVSKSNMQRIIRYIETQQEHHRRVTFAEEYLAFLRKAGIAYDERYVFE
jgi:putative transposase